MSDRGTRASVLESSCPQSAPARLAVRHSDGMDDGYLDASHADLTASAGAAFGLSRSRVTEHLRELAEAGLVRVTPEGPYRWYSLVDGAAAGVVRFIVARGLNSPG